MKESGGVRMLVSCGEGTRPQAELGGVKQVLSKLLHK